MPVHSIYNQGVSRYHDRYNLSMGGNAREHLARLELEIPLYISSKKVCDKKITNMEKQLKVGSLILKKEESRVSQDQTRGTTPKSMKAMRYHSAQLINYHKRSDPVRNALSGIQLP